MEKLTGPSSGGTSQVSPIFPNFQTDKRFSFRDSQDFSLSSVINYFSKRLDANSSSSFLMHVDDKENDTSETLMAVPDCHTTDMDVEAKLEVLRKMSGLDYQCRESLGQSFLTSTRMEEGDGGMNIEDSWDEFDKVMEKSLPAKDWELVEFEDLAQRSTVQVEEQFMSADEAKREMDKEEEFRAQFLQSEDATFVSEQNMSFSHNPLSMTNYFQSRSSFPVDNVANESTMLGLYESQNEKTLVGNRDTSIASNNNNMTDFLEEYLQSIEKKQSDGATPDVPSAIAVQKFLINSMSDGADHSEIANYILEACKASVQPKKPSRSKTLITCIDKTANILDPPISKSKNPTPPIIPIDSMHKTASILKKTPPQSTTLIACRDKTGSILKKTPSQSTALTACTYKIGNIRISESKNPSPPTTPIASIDKTDNIWKNPPSPPTNLIVSKDVTTNLGEIRQPTSAAVRVKASRISIKESKDKTTSRKKVQIAQQQPLQSHPQVTSTIASAAGPLGHNSYQQSVATQSSFGPGLGHCSHMPTEFGHPQQPGYAFPFSIHIHLPSFPPGIYPPHHGTHSAPLYATSSDGVSSMYSQHSLPK
ncbi:uncharacterized protein LOC110856188 isoform X2 [Folsomia candida]|uniref:uncharacterized protein LOC110856188 isoform X2 n=1 Tax=Folsomia candida TaxID=158441 RepID=UPI00160558DB|nr:uncharacterized protein LOC110856188 isoform X2 [Folsomia candida]